MHEIAKREDEFAARVVTVSPDVTVSTNLGAWVNRRNVYRQQRIQDLFRAEHIPSAYNWSMSPKGQHFELGIAEMNLFAMLSAMGLAHSVSGERLLPIGTLFDPFIERGLDALNYACYQDARFILVATPSGVTLASEGGAHQSIATPLIGMAQDRLTSFEPAFADELAVILRWGFEHIQAPQGRGRRIALLEAFHARPRAGLREMTTELESAILKGAYWLRRPGPNAQTAIAFTGAVTRRDRRNRLHRGGPSRRGPSFGHLGGSPLRRLDESPKGPRGGARLRRKPHRRHHGQPSFLLRACHRHRRSSGNIGLAGVCVRA